VFYTGTFYLDDSIEIEQCEAVDEYEALTLMLGKLPHDDANEFTEQDFIVITEILNSIRRPDVQPVTNRAYVWYWMDGSQLDNRIDCYVVATVSPPG